MLLKWFKISTSEIAVVCSFAFLAASNYCNLEAFAEPTHHHPSSHQSASAEHHEDGASTPSNQHEEHSVFCCSAMQAVVASRLSYQLASSSVWQLHPLILESVWLVSVFAPTRTASGLSPPTQESPPARPFYRTTFASHAPPVSLA